MGQFYERIRAYECDGTTHTLEIYSVSIPGAAPYIVMLDGAFVATAEHFPGAMEEVAATVKWFGWSYSNPFFA